MRLKKSLRGCCARDQPILGSVAAGLIRRVRVIFFFLYPLIPGYLLSLNISVAGNEDTKKKKSGTRTFLYIILLITFPELSSLYFI